MWKWVMSILVLIECASSQVPSSGKCPDIKTQTNFDLNKYVGVWHEIFKFYTSFESNQKCIQANYTLEPNGHVRVWNTALNTQDDKPVSAIGDGYAPDPNDTARLEVRFSEFAPYANYWIIDTDYENYTLVYSCKDFLGVEKFEFAWILSRTHNLATKDKDRLFEVLEKSGIKSSNFMMTDQTNCPS
ncbi:hypothetical protein ACJMK2_009584 [Sinanodonta woodiana]|uniref:Apolipoprotein D n=1 Tax=Sinanodonta woodiana TaxID=1069815 RepID=A0ABD3VCQ6_SINWO